MQQSDNIKKLFINKYATVGEEKFYKFLITYALNRIVEPVEKDKNSLNPALELMDYYDMFLKLYRREGDEIYLELSHQFRKAGHRIYRIMLKKGLVEKNNKFLQLI
jgi:hypothetical protein